MKYMYHPLLIVHPFVGGSIMILWLLFVVCGRLHRTLFEFFFNVVVELCLGRGYLEGNEVELVVGLTAELSGPRVNHTVPFARLACWLRPSGLLALHSYLPRFFPFVRLGARERADRFVFPSDRSGIRPTDGHVGHPSAAAAAECVLA